MALGLPLQLDTPDSPGVAPKLLWPPTHRCLSDLLRVQLHGSGVRLTGKTLHRWDLWGSRLGQDLCWAAAGTEARWWAQHHSGKRQLSQDAKLWAMLKPLKILAGFFLEQSFLWLCLLLHYLDRS